MIEVEITNRGENHKLVKIIKMVGFMLVLMPDHILQKLRDYKENPRDFEPYNESTAERLEASIRDEEDDINEYRKAAINTDPKTAKLFRHIAKQEVHHKEELKSRLKEIR